MDCSPLKLLCPWRFSRQEYWGELHALLQGIFPTQGSNPHLLCFLHLQVGSYHLGNLDYMAVLLLSLWTPSILLRIVGLSFTLFPIEYAAAAAKSLQSCPTLCNPIDGSPPGSLFLRFSRQEHWSGLPFPSPVHESEKWKWSRSVMSDSSQSHGLQPTRLLHPWYFPGKSSGVGCHCLLR